MAARFNAIASNENYSDIYDIITDNVINMKDIMVLAKSFNETLNDYPELKFDYTETTQTATSTICAVPTVTPTPSAVIPTEDGEWVLYTPKEDQVSFSLEKDWKDECVVVVTLTLPNDGFRVSYDPVIIHNVQQMPDGTVFVNFL